MSKLDDYIKWYGTKSTSLMLYKLSDMLQKSDYTIDAIDVIKDMAKLLEEAFEEYRK